MDERTQALTIVNASLPPLKRIDDLYAAASYVYQRSIAVQTTARANNIHKASILSGLAVFATWILGSLLFAVLSLLTTNPIILYAHVGCVITACVIVHKKINTKLSADDKKTLAVLQQNEQALAHISQEIELSATRCRASINALPRDYRYYYAAKFFEGALSNGRADSLKEAINLLELHLHQMRIENANHQILYQTQQQNNMLSAIEAKTQNAAAAANASTVFSVINFLYRV